MRSDLDAIKNQLNEIAGDEDKDSGVKALFDKLLKQELDTKEHDFKT